MAYYKKMVCFTFWNPPEEFVEYAKSIGYLNYYDLDCLFDERIVKFVEDHANWIINGENRLYNLYKGKADFNFKIGFAGFARVVQVDIDKTWRFCTKNKPFPDFPSIEYVDVSTDKYNHITISTDTDGGLIDEI